MKITKTKLKQIIKEELSVVLNEQQLDLPLNLDDDKKRVAGYISAWFGARAQGNTGFRGTNLSDYLRKGVAGEEISGPGRVSFKKALSEVAPENVEDGIEQDPNLLDSKKIGKKGDWYAVAKSL
jgi:hypothetical protein